MKKQISRKLISTLLVLAMLVSTLAVMSFGGAVSAAETTEAEESTEIRPSLDTTDELRFATQYYQSNWAGSSIVNWATYGKWVATDGSGNGAVQWGAGFEAATLSEDGILSFPATSNASIQFLPWQNANHNIQIGPARIAFEIYYDEYMPSMYLQHYAVATGSQKLFVLTNGSNVVKHGWGADVIGTMENGWNTIEMIFIPLDADGIICTESTDVVASNVFYARVIPEAEMTSDKTCYTPAYIEANFFKNANFAVKNHYRSMGSTILNITTSSDSQNVLKIRSAMAMNLTPYKEPDGLPVVSFSGFPTLTQSVEGGTSITLPMVEGVKAWVTDDSYYLPGETYLVQVTKNFNPVTDSMWMMSNGYNSDNTWNASIRESHEWCAFNAGDGWRPTLAWSFGQTTANMKTQYTYDSSNKAITILSTAAYTNGVDWYPLRTQIGSTQSKYSSNEYIVLGFDFEYIPGEFDGMSFTMHWTHTACAATTDGIFKVGSTNVGTLKEGWNNVRLYFVCNKNDSNAITSYNVYCALNTQSDDEMVSECEITSLPKTTWTVSGIADADDKRFQINIGTKGTGDTTTTLNLKSFKSYSMVKETVNTVAIPATRRMAIVPTGSEYTMPTETGVERWLTNDGAVNNVVAPGATITVDSDIVLTGAKTHDVAFKGASMTLGSTMALNLKVDPAAFSVAPTSGYVMAAGTSIKANADEALDAMGLLNAAITNIPACNMAQDLQLYMVAEIGGQLYVSATPKTYSPLQYAKDICTNIEAGEISDPDGSIKALVAAMLGYGAAAEKNAYNTTEIKSAADTLKLTLPSVLPENYYDDAWMTQAEVDKLNEIADTNMTLKNGVDIGFVLKNADAVEKLEVSYGGSTKTYTKDANGTIAVDGISAGAIKSTLTLKFVGETTTTVQFNIGEYLRRHLATNEALATATIIYMMTVRDYALMKG